MKKIALLIAKVCPLLEVSLSQILTNQTNQTEIEWLGTVQNVDDAVLLCQRHQADVLLLQWDTRSVETLHLLQTECPTTKVLVLIACSEAAQSFPATSELPQILAAGARGIVSIDDSIPMMTAAIHAIALGQRWTSPYLTSSHQPAVKPPVQELTRREQQVLALMVTGQTDKQIALALNIGERTVRDGLRSIYKKLNASSRVQATAEAVRRGLVK